ncbi:cysteine hydrolase family protein [Blastococcus mobilis]|uniref:Isochorismatase family protein n=1 Tax=Blastococcus mobilis TaxID=1938746 RepID=A0A239AGC4_9ACTN|nr:isochorismatase family protein [Blastococcus mobilis]SNR94431.1 Isochorismatase family protein [Blastococcus mobilis]
MPAVSRLVRGFRDADRPIVHVVRLYEGADVDLPRRSLIESGAPVVRPGSAGSQLAPELRPPGAPLDVSTVVIAGCNYPNCPRATVYDASEHDYRTLIAADAISGLRRIHLQEAGRMGVLHASSDEILRRLSRGTGVDASHVS